MARDLSPADRRALISAGMADAACLLGGAALFFATGSWVWLAAGALLGAAFSGPVVIRLMRSKGSSDA